MIGGDMMLEAGIVLVLVLLILSSFLGVSGE